MVCQRRVCRRAKQECSSRLNLWLTVRRTVHILPLPLMQRGTNVSNFPPYRAVEPDIRRRTRLREAARHTRHKSDGSAGFSRLSPPRPAASAVPPQRKWSDLRVFVQVMGNQRLRKFTTRASSLGVGHPSLEAIGCLLPRLDLRLHCRALSTNCRPSACPHTIGHRHPLHEVRLIPHNKQHVTPG